MLNNKIINHDIVGLQYIFCNYIFTPNYVFYLKKFTDSAENYHQTRNHRLEMAMSVTLNRLV